MLLSEVLKSNLDLNNLEKQKIIGAEITDANHHKKIIDLHSVIEDDTQISRWILLDDNDLLGLEILRHSTAHLLAHAVKNLYKDQVKIAIGPVIENGFYYDFDFAETIKLSPEDFLTIETEMQRLASLNLNITKTILSREQAISFFKNNLEEYKLKIIDTIPLTENISCYQQDNFSDLCRGPHVLNTGLLKIFKLTKIAGAYWQGDAKNKMLTRIYGTAWVTAQALKDYLYQIAEAEKRDHRKLGKQMDLFHFQEEAPGMPFWHPHGLIIFQTLENFLRAELTQQDYQEVKTPLILNQKFWEASGHLANYRESMFMTECEEVNFAIKPMSCPCHVQIFKHSLKSYRDLPLRFAEFGLCHRFEASGTLHGLLRVRQLTQDDAHIFCRENQIESEVRNIIEFILKIYNIFDFKKIDVRLSTRPEKKLGDDKLWDHAEEVLKNILNNNLLLKDSWHIAPGEGAFYGPKIDFFIQDSLNRTWQISTVQLDYGLAQRLEAYYINEHNEKNYPVIIHRAILGTLERSIGILLEHYAGLLPLWLAPTQIAILPISEHQLNYAKNIDELLILNHIRTQLDLRNEKIGLKIREFSQKRVNYLAIIGNREMESNTLALRNQAGEQLGVFSVEQLLAKLNSEIINKK